MTKMRTGEEAQAALREENRQRIERAGEMLTGEELMALPSSIRDGLLGVVRPEGMRFPRFQVVLDDTEVAVPPAWSTLRILLAPARWDDEFLLIWTLAPNAYLDGDSPASEIQAHRIDVTSRLRHAAERAVPQASRVDWVGEPSTY